MKDGMSARQQNDPHFCCKFTNQYHTEKDVKLRGDHPQQTIHFFKNGEKISEPEQDAITFSSQFDSGNMKNCTSDQPDTYNIYISPDSIPYDPKGHYKTWFYFSVKGIQKDQEITLSIRNMGNQGRLFKNGLRPVYRSASNMKWKRVHGKVDYKLNSQTNYFLVNWKHKFDKITGPEEEVYFAYTYPYSFTESLNKTQNLLKRY